MKNLVKTVLFTFLFVSIILADNGNTPSVQFHNTTIFRGFQTESNFGANAVNIGDFNADGYEDLAISADGEDEGLGKVYLYFGGENGDTRPDVIFEPLNDYDGFGYKVASAGDFNADGFDDIVIVSKNYVSNSPSVMVYFGGPNYDTNPDVFLQKYWDVPGFGDDVAGLGDVNGDGIDDIGVVTATSMGIYFGSLNPPYYVEMGQSLNQSGYNIEYCGDVNGDGYNDIIASFSNYNQVFIYKGGPDLDANVDQFFVSPETDTYFGFQLSAGGDINGDGYADVVVGEMGVNTHTGRALVYFGAPDMFTSYSGTGSTADLIIDGPSTNSNFGSAVAIVKDMNGDGFDELAVAGSNLNYMNLYYGGRQISDIPSQIYYSKDLEYGYFFAISSLDFNGNGYNEVVAGDYERDMVYLFSNKFEGVVWESDIKLSNYLNGDINGDFNGDGKNDLLSGNKIYSGISNMTNGIPEITFTSNSGTYSVFTGDVTGDGFDDVVATNTDGTVQTDIFFGNDNGEEIFQRLIPEDNDYRYYFYDYGDFNNDGYDDMLFDKRKNDNSESIGYIYLGGETISSYPSYFINDDNNSKFYSFMAADFNGDGFDDVIAQNYDEKNIVVFLFSAYGITNKIVIELNDIGLNPEESFYPVYPGDYNNDGYDDFVIIYGVDKNIVVIYGMPTYGDVEFINLPSSTGIKNGDFNGDGVSDIYLTSSGIIYGGKDFPNLRGPIIGGIDFYPDEYGTIHNYIKSTGDVNGDGMDDISYTKWDAPDGSVNGIIFSSIINVAPRMKSIKDVPADQGGKVTLTWFKSGYEDTNVMSYQIERSIAPVAVGFAWEVIGNVPISHLNYYSYTAPTLNDRTSEYSGNTYFRITALTDDPDVFYSSNILYGNSVDNLAPLPVNGLAAIPTTEGVKVSWKLNSEDDLKEYKIYRSTEEEVNFDTLAVYGTTTDSVFVDKTPLNESVYYFVRGTDIHENIGISSSIYLNITGVNESEVLPTEFALMQNYPNPFNPSTTITFALPKQTDVKLVVYNSIGEKVATLINKEMNAGFQSVNFDAYNLSSGLYLYKIKAGNFVDVKKMMLLK